MSLNYRITPEGTRDFVFEECAMRRELEQKMSGLFQARGFTEVTTPEIEFLDVFTVKNHPIPVEDMYKLSDRKGRLIALRADSTMPIARVFSTRLKDELLPMRLFYNQKVYRSTPSLAGHSDEILQSGIEIIGAKGKRADLEVIATAVEALGNLGISDYRLEIGHIAIFNRLMEKLWIDDELGESIRELIETKNYPALNDLVDSRLDETAAGMIKRLPRLFGSDEVFDEAIKLFHDEEITKTVEYLRGIYNDLTMLGLQNKISVDLGMVNRASYYTGVLFRGYISGFGQAVLSGGRYDNLLTAFGKPSPATGFGINLDAILASLFAVHSVKRELPADILVYSEDSYEMNGLLYARDLIAQNKRVEHSVFETLEESKQYALKKGIPEIVIVGETVQTIQL